MTEVVQYNVGDGVAFVAAGRTLLLDQSLGNAATEQLWAVVSEADSLHDLIESLTGYGLRKLGDFALLFLDAEGCHVIVRGGACAKVTSLAGTEEVTAAGTVTWSERTFEGAALVELSLGNPSTLNSLPFGSGVVHASRVSVALEGVIEARISETDDSSDDLADLGESELLDVIVVEDAGPTLIGVADSLLQDQLATRDEPLADEPEAREEAPQQTLAPADVREDVEDGQVDFSRPQGSTVLPLEVLEKAGGTGDPEEDDFDDLFGATLFRAIEGAAVRESDDLEERAEPKPKDPPTIPNLVSKPEEPAFFAASSPPLPKGAPTVLPPASGEGLIDGVPGMGDAGRAAQPSPSSDDSGALAAQPADLSISREEDDPENFTISRARLKELKRTAAGQSADSPRVHGVYCDEDHPNPPQATYCRVCGSALEQLEPVTIPRPVLGTLRFSNGVEAELDGPIVIGRSPRAERVSSKEIPQLVTLPSPDQNISRNHLEVKLDGWHVLVVDLDSVNGTVVTNPGEAPVLLRSGEEVPIVVGSVVTIADEITFVFEVSE